MLCQEQELAKMKINLDQCIEEQGTEGLVSVRQRKDTLEEGEGLSFNASAMG